MLNECGQLWASRAAQALDARLTNHVVYPSVNPALEISNLFQRSRVNDCFFVQVEFVFPYVLDTEV